MKKMNWLTNEQQKSYQNGNWNATFVKKNLKIDMLKIKSIVKLETIVIIQLDIEVHSKFKI